MREVGDVHFSERFDRERRYLFHLCRIDLPGVNLSRPNNRLERSLARHGRPWAWIREEEFARPAAHELSPTVTPLRAAVLQTASGR